MALRFIDGFDHYTTRDQLLYKYNTAGSSSYVVLDDGRRAGSQAVRLYAGSGYIVKSFDEQATWVAGVALKLDALPTGNGAVFMFLDVGGDAQACLCISSTGALILKRGSTSGITLATSDEALQAGKWYYVEGKITIANSGGTFSARINGRECASYTGDTRYSTSYEKANAIKMYGMPSAVKIWYDDLYICDGTGSSHNDYLGDVRVDTLFPSAAGNATEFTPTGSANNWENVDDTSPDEDTSYNASDTAGQKDSFGFSDLSALSSTVLGVQANMLVRKDDAGTRILRSLIRTGGTDYEGSDLSLADSYTNLTQIWMQNPSTAAAWTEAEVNAAEFGYKVQS